ncbi:MAG: DNA-binding transcriptional regulator, partial [Verrucomicrobiota bacterium]|nr:DNA-binding transcriptional regulator [Verrucomicrobiota bacterium]
MLEVKKVALRFSLNSDYTRRIVRGVISYMHKHGPWEIDIRNKEPFAFTSWRELKDWEGDGIIAPVYSQNHLNMLIRKGIPVVNTADTNLELPFPTIHFDDEAIGRMAAEHLLQHKLDRFAFIGPKEFGYSTLRCESYAAMLKGQGAPCTKCWIRPVTPTSMQLLDDSWIEDNYYIDALKQLEPPVGIFAANDQVGYGILRACRQLGLRSPEDICLVAVDDDELLCNMAWPNLSSIALAADDFGYRAAKMLDLQMQGKELFEHKVVIPPTGVVTRNSSDFLTVEDRYVADALRYIRNHSGRFIDVSDVMSVMPISRRSLERRFQDVVGHGIYKEINRCHIERAKGLLETTDHAISR